MVLGFERRTSCSRLSFRNHMARAPASISVYTSLFVEQSLWIIEIRSGWIRSFFLLCVATVWTGQTFFQQVAGGRKWKNTRQTNGSTMRQTGRLIPGAENTNLREVSRYRWPPVYFVWIQLLCLFLMNNSFTCLVKPKPVKQEVNHLVILPSILGLGESLTLWLVSRLTVLYSTNKKIWCLCMYSKLLFPNQSNRRPAVQCRVLSASGFFRKTLPIH